MITLECNYSKKIGLPGYSSHQFSITLKTEISDLNQVQPESARLSTGPVFQGFTDSKLEIGVHWWNILNRFGGVVIFDRFWFCRGRLLPNGNNQPACRVAATRANVRIQQTAPITKRQTQRD